MFCENCGNKLPEGAKFCGGCGAKTDPIQPSNIAAAAPAPARPVPPPPAYTPSVQAAPSYQQAYVHQQQNPANSWQSGCEPLRVGQYIGMFLLMCVPILSIILLFMWGFGSSVNPNKKNFARAMLILAAIGVILGVIFGAALTSVIGNMLNGMGGYY